MFTDAYIYNFSDLLFPDIGVNEAAICINFKIYTVYKPILI